MKMLHSVTGFVLAGTAWTVLVAAMMACPMAFPQPASASSAPQKIILDTDIGDDIDDAFALALALKNPKVQLLGVTTAWGDTPLRARLVERFLRKTGHPGVPVAAGPETVSKATFTQARWARHDPKPEKPWPNAVDFILNAIRKYPGQITLVSIAPFSDVGAVISKDPATFRKLKRVVIMGGSIRRGYGDLGYLPDKGPSPEYNVRSDIAASRQLFASGVPLYVMPLDSTQLKLDEVMRRVLFSQDTRTSNVLSSLYWEWTASTLDPTPTLFDAMAVSYVIDPALCPTTPMRIEVDSKGYTRVTPGRPNANVCLRSDSDQFFHFYIHAVLERSSQTQR